jgi:hypothetical protein
MTAEHAHQSRLDLATNVKRRLAFKKIPAPPRAVLLDEEAYTGLAFA